MLQSVNGDFLNIKNVNVKLDEIKIERKQTLSHILQYHVSVVTWYIHMQ